MVKIFFGCSMMGGYNAVPKEELAKLANAIEELGHTLASRHQTQDWIRTEAKLTQTDIHDRDFKWGIESDIGIFEISNPSLGVGGEISDMTHMGKPVLCLFKKDLKNNVSAYTRGKMGSQYIKTPFEVYAYTTIEDAKDKIKEFVESNS